MSDKSAEDNSDRAPTREPLQPDEVSVATKLRSTLEESTTAVAFFCGGHVAFNSKNPAILYTQKAGDALGSPKIFSLAAIGDVTALAEFHDDCNASPFGRGNELVYDEAYRLARELESEQFGLNFDPLNRFNGVLDDISTVTDMQIWAELYKINSYAQGGMFKPHQDSPRGKLHVGTLVICLPTPFEGGQFVLRRGGHEHVFDWSKSGRKDSPEELHWLFFFSDVTHEVQEVTAGYRLTLSYNIYRIEADSERHISAPIDYRTLPFWEALVEGFKDPKFLPNGGKLAFGLAHEYPVKGSDWRTDFESQLKGKDAILGRALKGLDLEMEVFAVYRLPYEEYWEELEQEDQEHPLLDDFDCVESAGEEMIYLLSENFAGVTGKDDNTGNFETYRDETGTLPIWGTTLLKSVAAT